MDTHETDILVLIDVQNDFCAGGSLAVPGGDEIVPLVNQIAQDFRHVVLTQDWHPAGHSSFASSHPGAPPFSQIITLYGPQTLWPDHCVIASHGARFHPGLNVPHTELVIRKGFRSEVDSYSAFFENDHVTPTGLAGYLRERGFTRVYLAGLAFDYCVRYSAEDARAQGFETFVIEAACRAIDLNGSAEDTRRAFQAKGIALI
jgi:nicotinamidase/pyrazinamidase